ncbi:DUF937 domain-containing protein [Naumannella sp. ID2617S]|nr:DUF937 domain-containing protein [Naumannella sp. ID2617S]
MNKVDEILSGVPMDQLADQVGADPQTVSALSEQLVGALITGMSANADDPGGVRSLATALDNHSGSDLLAGGVDLEMVDTDDGQAIVRNVFGNNTDAVTQTLSSQFAGGNSSLVKKLLPILAPIVLAYLGKRLSQGQYGDILGPILSGLGGAAGGGSGGRQQGGPSLPDILLDMLGGGSGQRAPEQPAPAPRRQDPAPQQRAPQQTPAPAPPAPPAPSPGGDPNDPDAPAADTIPLDDEPAPQADQGRQQSGGASGDVLIDILGGLLGGGRRG